MGLVGFRLVGYCPQEGWLVLLRSDCVRHEGPVRAAYFRPVLSHVRGFPTLRVLRWIRLPKSIRRAFPFTVLLRLPVAHVPVPRVRLRHSPVSGFPLACLSIRLPYAQP